MQKEQLSLHKDKMWKKAPTQRKQTEKSNDLCKP